MFSLISLTRQQVFDDFDVFLDIADQAAGAVAHCFKKTDGHAFDVTGQDEQIRVTLQLLEKLVMHKAGQDDPRVFRCHSCDFVHIFLCIAAHTGNHKLFIRRNLPESLDQVMNALLGNDARKRQDIIVSFQAVLLRNDLRLQMIALVDAVRNSGSR